MDMEPINIFSRRIDPRGVLTVLRSLPGELQVDGPDEDWIEARLTVRSSTGQELVLGFRHDSEYYEEPDWPQQMLGMQGYFSNFPDGPFKADVLRLIQTFRFALATDWQPDLIDDDDPRLEALCAIASHLDAALFTPSTMRDAGGRVLLDAEGSSDPDAVLPTIPDLPLMEVSLDEHDESADEGDDEYEENPPSADEVIRRALALTAVTARALAEQADPEEEGIQEYRQDIVAWVTALDLGDELEPDEWKVLQRPIGQLDQRATIDSTWRLEGLGVLAWALGRFEVPAPDVLVDPQELLSAMCFLDLELARELLANPELRSPEDLTERGKQFLGVHWRLRDFTLRPEPMDFVEFSKDCWFGSFDISSLRLIDNDLALGDDAVADAEEDLFSMAYSAARERHLAINWLHWGGSYSETDTST